MGVPLAVLLAATVRFTLPALDADTTGGAVLCAAGPRTCADLDSVFVWIETRGSRSPRQILAANVRGREGQPFEAGVPDDSVATVWVVTQDIAGNRSCPSNHVGLNLVASVPPAAAAPALEWFDVAGRRLAAMPTAPGVYFWRRGRERGVRVVLR